MHHGEREDMFSNSNNVVNLENELELKVDLVLEKPLKSR
jgi:hypothetical protein